MVATTGEPKISATAKHSWGSSLQRFFLFAWQAGKQPEFSFPVRDHVVLGEGLDLFDFDTAAEVSVLNSPGDDSDPFHTPMTTHSQLQFLLLSFCL
jgi:hypothetical protein